jgi:hypothetical protein
MKQKLVFLAFVAWSQVWPHEHNSHLDHIHEDACPLLECQSTVFVVGGLLMLSGRQSAGFPGSDRSY